MISRIFFLLLGVAGIVVRKIFLVSCVSVGIYFFTEGVYGKHKLIEFFSSSPLNFL